MNQSKFSSVSSEEKGKEISPGGKPEAERPEVQPEKIEPEKSKVIQEKKEVPKKVPPKLPPKKPAITPRIQKDTENVKKLTKKRQVQTLVNMAFEKGIHHAISVAKNLDDPYMLDLFHDRLTGELYNHLVKSKKIKEL